MPQTTVARRVRTRTISELLNAVGAVVGIAAQSEIFADIPFDDLVDTTPPIAPSNLRAQATAHDRVLLTADDNEPRINDIEVERSTDGTTFVYADDDTILEGLSPRTRYFFRMRARIGNTYSSWTNVAEATTPDVPADDPGDGDLSQKYPWMPLRLKELPVPALREPTAAAKEVNASGLIAALKVGAEIIWTGGIVAGRFDVPDRCAIWARGVCRVTGPSGAIVVNFGSLSYTSGIDFSGGGTTTGKADNNSAIGRITGDNATIVDCIFQGGAKCGGLTIMGRGARLIRVVCKNNGTYGLGGTRAHESRIYDCKIHDNNTLNVADGGGGKFTRTKDQVFTRTEWDNNNGPNVWHDFENEFIALISCRATRGKTKGRFGGNGWMFEVSKGPALAWKCYIDGRDGNEGIFVYASLNFLFIAGTIIGGSKGAAVQEDRGDNDHGGPEWEQGKNVVVQDSFIYSTSEQYLVRKVKDGGGNHFEKTLPTRAVIAKRFAEIGNTDAMRRTGNGAMRFASSRLRAQRAPRRRKARRS